MVVGAPDPGWSASITMSASSSEVDAGGAGAGVVGWAPAVPPANPARPISTIATGTSNRIDTRTLQILYA